METMLYLSNRVVRELLSADDVVRLAEETFRAHAAGQITWSIPRMLSLKSDRMEARFGVKLCSVDSINVVGFRLTSVNRGVERMDGAPSRMVLLSDPNTGHFFAMVDERWSYAVRTGAGAAVAMRHLHGPDTTEVGLIGAGLMARGTAHALKAAVPLKKLLVTSRRPETRTEFATELEAELGIEVEPVASAEEVLARMNAVVACTTANAPFIPFEWLRPGCTIYSMGEHQELDTTSYLCVDKFIVDDWEQVKLKPDMKELMAKGQFSENRVHADLSQIVTGARTGREREDERIMIRSQGLVTMDLAVSNHLYRKALELGAGQPIEV